MGKGRSRRVYFVIYFPGGAAQLQRSAIVGNVVQAPLPQREINAGAKVTALPVVSDDDLALYFSDPDGARDAGNPNVRMFVATRPSDKAQWGTPQPVPVAAGVQLHTGKEFADFISADACRLYFHRDGDLFVAHRKAAP